MSQLHNSDPTADDLRAKVFRDREHSGDWRVEKMDNDGGIELALFSGDDARQQAISYADRVYSEFDELELHPYHRAPPLGQVLDDLSHSAISVTIDALPAAGGGYFFRIGDAEKSTEGSADSIFDLVLALVGSAIRTFPASRFAEQYRGKTL
jgi:hypothetical protein